VNLSPTQQRQLWRLLGLLDVHLCSAIESSLMGSDDPMIGEPMPEDATTVKQDRRDLMKVREWRKILHENLGVSNAHSRTRRTKSRRGQNK